MAASVKQPIRILVFSSAVLVALLFAEQEAHADDAVQADAPGAGSGWRSRAAGRRPSRAPAGVRPDTTARGPDTTAAGPAPPPRLHATRSSGRARSTPRPTTHRRRRLPRPRPDFPELRDRHG